MHGLPFKVLVIIGTFAVLSILNHEGLVLPLLLLQFRFILLSIMSALFLFSLAGPVFSCGLPHPDILLHVISAAG